MQIFFVNGTTGVPVSFAALLAPTKTLSLLASNVVTSTTSGYVLAVAIDGATGCPTSHNFLVGSESVKQSSGYTARLGAVAFAALFSGRLAGCGTGSTTATIAFNGTSTGYNAAPRVSAINTLPSRADGNNHLLIVNRVGGNLTGSASSIGTLFGLLYDDAENVLSFSSNITTCHLASALSNSFPRITPSLDTFIPAGRSGWMKLNLWTTDMAVLAATIQFNPNAGVSAGDYNGGQNLHTQTLTTSASYTIPVSVPAYANTPTIASTNPSSATAGGAAFTLTVNGTGFTGSSRLRWNGADRTTTFVSATQLTATIPASDVASAGTVVVSIYAPLFDTSSNAVSFTINATARVLRVVSANGSAGGIVTVPVELLAQGNENSMSFSISLDASLLSSPQFSLGTDAASAGATLTINVSQAAQGRYGLSIALPSGQVFQAGTRQVLTLSAVIAAGSSPSTTTVSFGDSPTVRRVTDVSGQTLAANYSSGSVTIVQGYEADVSPRPNGSNGTVTIADWVQTGRFVARIDTASSGNEFQRADCAPRGTLGNGRMSIADWVQAGRYASGLDAVQSAGGSTSETGSASQLFAGPRAVQAVNATFTRGQTGTLSVELASQGNENAVGFTLVYDPAILSNPQVALGNGAGGAVLNVNISQASSGLLGITLALSAGQTLSTGTRQLVTVSFMASAASTANSTAVSFSDQLVDRETADANATAVAANYVGGVITLTPTFNPVPTLTGLSPNAANAGGAAFTLTVNGTNFVNGSVVRWNGSDRPTAFVSSGQLTASIFASDLAAAGTSSVTVVNPSPGGGTSNAVTFTITACTYTFQTTSQTFDAAGGNGSVSVSVPAGCAWTAASNASWLTITSGASGSGNGTVNFSVMANVGTATRSGALTITGGQSFAVTQTGANSIAVVNSASFASSVGLAAELDVAAFGTGLSSATVIASTNPLPTTLNGVTVTVRDVTGTDRLAGLFFVSPGQINFQIPAGTANGSATIFVKTGSSVTGITSAQIATVAPGLFSKCSNGTGAAFGRALRITGAGSQTYENLSDAACNALTINLGPPSDQVFLVLHGTGFRNRSSLSAVSVKIGGVDATVSYAGVASDQPYVITNSGVGEDQLNVLVPRSLAGRGTVDIVTTVDGKTANTVQVSIGTATAGPAVSSISPASPATSSSDQSVTINGSGFQSGLTVTVTFPSGGQSTLSGSQIQSVTSTSFVMRATLNTAGVWSLRVNNPDGGQSNTFSFTVVAPNNPVPVLSSLSPNSATAGGAAYTLTVNGSNFINGSVVRWNGSDRVTTFASATQLTVQITAADIASTGTVSVTVFNPTPGGGLSNAASLTINQGNPVPVISGLTSPSVTAGSVAFTLTVNGSNFVSGAVVRFNGSDRQTTLVSGTQLTAQITAADVAVAGTAQITVFNPSPGGGLSVASTFTIVALNPVPAISNLNPPSATAGGAAFTVAVNGSNFVNGAVVRWNNSERTTIFVSATQLTAQITAADIAAPGVVQVTVVNPAPGGGTSNALSLTINPACPNVTSINPTSGAVGANVVISGTNLTGVTVKFTGVATTAQVVSSSDTQLVVTVPSGATNGPLSLSKPGCGNVQTPAFTVVTGNVISGAVRYCITGEPVTAVTVTATAINGATVATTTGTTGQYGIGGLAPNFYSVAPAKTGEVRGLSAYDAALVAQNVINGGTPDRCRRQAADADLDGVLTIEDARLILRQVVGLADAGQAGKWRFDPGSRQYTPLNSDQINQNYDAVLIGDVSGNWARSPGLAIASVQLSEEAKTSEALAAAAKWTISGSGFELGLTLAVTFPDGREMRLSGGQIAVVSPETLMVALALNVRGLWTFRVINADGKASDAFVVKLE